jgi:hypothetical protein
MYEAIRVQAGPADYATRPVPGWLPASYLAVAGDGAGIQIRPPIRCANRKKWYLCAVFILIT